jgi:hypothetical protein
MVGRTGLNVPLTFVQSWILEVTFLEVQANKLARSFDLTDKAGNLQEYGMGASLLSEEHNSPEVYLDFRAMCCRGSM